MEEDGEFHMFSLPSFLLRLKIFLQVFFFLEGKV